MKITLGELREMLAQHDICSHGGRLEDGCEEFGYTSPCGEDFTFTLWYMDNAESLAEAFAEYAEKFDPEEHAVNWYNEKNNITGVPESLKDLLKDAEDIKAVLLDAAKDINFAVLYQKVFDGVADSKDSASLFLNFIVDALLDYESPEFELTRDSYEQIKVDSHNGEDSIKVRWRGEQFDITISKAKETL